MSTLKMEIRHSLSQPEALSRIKKLLERLQEEHSDIIGKVKEDWTDNKGNFSFTARGFVVSGDIRVEPGQIYLEGKLPAMLSLFKSRISTVIKQEANRLLN